jgi:hypothetical protein
MHIPTHTHTHTHAHTNTHTRTHAQEYGETVLCVGTSYRAANACLFKAADLSLLQSGLPMSQPLSSLPRASPTQLSSADILFNRCARLHVHWGSVARWSAK